MKAQLLNGPLAIAMSASNQTFRFYESGIIRFGEGCETSINHAVVITGYNSEEGYWTI